MFHIVIFDVQLRRGMLDFGGFRRTTCEFFQFRNNSLVIKHEKRQELKYVKHFWTGKM